jgi:ATP-binding cassette subfamily F protein 3
VGFFAQHQVDELIVAETPLQHMISARPGILQTKLRAQLAGFGLGPDQADTAVGRLSGGQKARLSLLLATLDAPHLLILDEPTNHLDIESREALVEALTAYSGAVILVSHDMHLLSMVADRLWLVSDGSVKPYEDDLEAYRQMLLTPAKPVSKAPKPKEAPKAKRASRDDILALRKEVRTAEARVTKINEMRDKLAIWNKKYAEVMDALDRAEALWMTAEEKLEKATA